MVKLLCMWQLINKSTNQISSQWRLTATLFLAHVALCLSIFRCHLPTHIVVFWCHVPTYCLLLSSPHLYCCLMMPSPHLYSSLNVISPLMLLPLDVISPLTLLSISCLSFVEFSLLYSFYECYIFECGKNISLAYSLFLISDLFPFPAFLGPLYLMDFFCLFQ